MSNVSTLERLKEFLIHEGLSIRQFEISVGMSNGSFSSQLKRSGSIGVDRLENILKVYPALNPIWLLKGTGEMLTTHQEATNELRIDELRALEAKPPAHSRGSDALTREKIGRLEDRLKSMERENALLREMIDVLKAH